MKVLNARFRDRQAFVDAYQPQLPAGGVLLPCDGQRVGTELLVKIGFPGLTAPVPIRGSVRMVTAEPETCIEFHSEHCCRRDFLLGIARGDLASIAQRRHQRFAITLQVGWRLKDEGSAHQGALLNIGAGGAFVRTLHGVSVGSQVVIEVAPPAGISLAIEGLVTWTTRTPGSEGLGIAFRQSAGASSRLVEHFLRHVVQLDQLRPAL
jgi:Tfp pilus assembly protein PilZ